MRPRRISAAVSAVAAACAVAAGAVAGCNAILGIDRGHLEDDATAPTDGAGVDADTIVDGSDEANVDGGRTCPPCASSYTCVDGVHCGNEIANVTLGHELGCAILYDKTVWCWGVSSSDSLGAIDAGTVCPSGLACRPTAAPLPGLSDVAEVALGSYFGCARMPTGTVLCWGQNDRWQLGHQIGGADGTCGTYPCNPQPTAIVSAGLPAMTKISAGIATACGLGQDKMIYCWGYNHWGELGLGNFDASFVLPGPISGGGSYSDVVVGYGDNTVGTIVCGLRVDGKVACWGSNALGGLGHDPGIDHDSGAGSASATPTIVTLDGSTPLTDVVSIGVGYAHACALKSNGSVWCWGSNASRELGIGNADSLAHPAPTEVLNGANPYIALTLLVRFKTNYIVVAGPNGQRLLGWGNGSACQLGESSRNEHGSPVLASPLTVGTDNVVSGIQFAAVKTSLTTLVAWGANFNGELGHIPGQGPPDASDILINDGGNLCNPYPLPITGLP